MSWKIGVHESESSVRSVRSQVFLLHGELEILASDYAVVLHVNADKCDTGTIHSGG